MSFERICRLKIPNYLVKLPEKNKSELENLAEKCNVPWYLKPRLSEAEERAIEKERMEALQNEIRMYHMKKPLIERLRMGMDYCTKDEFYAFLWLKRLFEGIYYKEHFAGEKNPLKYKGEGFEVCIFEVKYTECNPWIVNTIMEQLGVKLLECKERFTSISKEEVPCAVRFTYETFEVDIINEMCEMT